MADRDLVSALSLLDQLRSALQRSDRARIVDIARQLIGLRAPIGEQWQQLAYVIANYGEVALAREAMDLFVAAAGGGPGAQFQKVAFLLFLGAGRDADALMRTLPQDVPDPATNAYRRGAGALNVGNRDEARLCFEEAVRLRPQSGHAWFSLAMAADFSNDPDLADRLIAAERDVAQATLLERIPYHYALGKMRADRGEHALAFDAFAQGAQLMRSTVAYSRSEDRADAAKAVHGYSAERISAIARQQRTPTGRTIFVAGLPRSGTTLVEQILTSHSTVSDGGEISRLFLLANETGGASHAALARYVQAQGTAHAARLWHHWLDELFPGSGRIVDKTVTTSRFLGLAAALLPEAPLIWMTRDPLDRAWSCFRTNFSGNALSWSYDLEDIAGHFRLEDQLLAQWQDILGDRLLVLPYEALVSDPGTWIRRLLAHCQLAEEPRVFAPHENPRAVPTASMMQVRRPINREGIGVAEPYRPFLGRFLDAYEA